MENLREKEALLKMFSIHFETNLNLPPLASRILSTLIVDGCRQGVTFESLVDRMEASKSSVSTSLNLLLKLGKISYYFLPNDRKKYFKSAPFSERMSNYIKILDMEKQLIDKMMSYRKNTISCREEQLNLENIKEYQSYILGVEKMMLTAIDKFKEIEINNT